jgi:ATP-dependent DNA ligase
LLSCDGKSLTARFASIARAREALPYETIIDGEIIACGDDCYPVRSSRRHADSNSRHRREDSGESNKVLMRVPNSSIWIRSRTWRFSFGGFVAALFKQFHGLEGKTCPFKNLPEARRGHWGEGMTAAEMEKCRWLKPRLVATIDYLERAAANHLRHPMFAGLSENFSVLRTPVEPRPSVRA